MATNIDLALEVRQFFGPLLIPHEQWGSRVFYSAARRVSTNQPKRGVAHHHGISAQVPRITHNAVIHGDLEAEFIQIRFVDKIHGVDNKWTNAFAYRFYIPARVSPLIIEGRNWWVPHGAHLGDPLKTDAPIYFPLGVNDDGMTDAQLENFDLFAGMLRELFGIQASSWTDHGNVEGNATSCAGPHIRPFILRHATGQPQPEPLPPKGDPIVSQLRTLRMTWKPGYQPTDLERRDVQRLQNGLAIVGVLDLTPGLNFNRTTLLFDGLFGPSTETAVREYQRSKGLQVDGVVGSFTWAALFEVSPPR